MCEKKTDVGQIERGRERRSSGERREGAQAPPVVFVSPPDCRIALALERIADITLALERIADSLGLAALDRLLTEDDPT